VSRLRVGSLAVTPEGDVLRVVARRGSTRLLAGESTPRPVDSLQSVGRGVRLSSLQIRETISHYAAEAPPAPTIMGWCEQVAERSGCSVATVYRIARREGIEPRVERAARCRQCDAAWTDDGPHRHWHASICWQCGVGDWLPR